MCIIKAGIIVVNSKSDLSKYTFKENRKEGMHTFAFFPEEKTIISFLFYNLMFLFLFNFPLFKIPLTWGVLMKSFQFL